MQMPARHLLFEPQDWFSLMFWHTGGLALVLQNWQVGLQAGLQAASSEMNAVSSPI